MLFKIDLLMKFICEGYTSEVKRLLREAPDEPAFLDSREFYFGMFMHSIEKSKESKMISPIAVAVNVGDYDLVDELLNSNFKIAKLLKAYKMLTLSLVWRQK